MIQAAQAVIDLAALQHNLQRIREAAPKAKIMAVVKADAYGHGLARIARALHRVEAFGVARLDEAVRLREAGITQPITLLEGFFEAADLALIGQYRLDVVVHHFSQIEILECTPLLEPVTVWLKIDSGMHRLGFAPWELMPAWVRLTACPSAAKPLRLMTHLACADDRTDSYTSRQITCFNAAVVELQAEKSIANSAAILGWPETHAEWVRPGLMLYGASPFPATSAHNEGLRPVMSLTAGLMAVNRFKKGDSVGYGASWACPEDMPVGVVAIGYGDGYPRHAVVGTPVLVNSRRVPLVGRISMDMLCVDLRTQPEAEVGDPVVLWGKNLPVEEVATCASTIPYELLCGVARRVRFVESGNIT